MFPLFETVRIEEGRAQHLEWHQARMDASAQQLFGKSVQFSLTDIVPDFSLQNSRILKWRVAYSLTDFEMQCHDYKPSVRNSLKLVFNDSSDYRLKYSDRKSLEKMFATRGECDDILIVKNNEITDTSIANIVFWDGLKWVTPKNPLLPGTARARLLAEGRIGEETILVNDLSHFKGFKLVNAMLPFEQQPVNEIENIQF